MKELMRHLADEEATVTAGEALGRAVLDCGLDAGEGGGVTAYLHGQLGAGKTTFCRGVLRAFGHCGAVKSPTYTLVEPYEQDAGRVYHFDLYRLGEAEELEFMGVRDYFAPGSLSLVEWPERGAGVLPPPDLEVTLSLPERGRQLQLQARTPLGERLLAALGQLEP